MIWMIDLDSIERSFYSPLGRKKWMAFSSRVTLRTDVSYESNVAKPLKSPSVIRSLAFRCFYPVELLRHGGYLELESFRNKEETIGFQPALHEWQVLFFRIMDVGLEDAAVEDAILEGTQDALVQESIQGEFVLPKQYVDLAENVPHHQALVGKNSRGTRSLSRA